MIETVCQTDSLDAEQERLEQELRIIAENLANLIQKNASVALDQTEQAESCMAIIPTPRFAAENLLS